MGGLGAALAQVIAGAMPHLVQTALDCLDTNTDPKTLDYQKLYGKTITQLRAEVDAQMKREA